MCIRDRVLPVREDYDHIIIDTSPYFNKLTAEILKISDLVIIPTLLEDDSMKGVMTTIRELMALFGESIRCRVLATMVDRSKYAENLFTALKEDIGTLCFDTYSIFSESMATCARVLKDLFHADKINYAVYGDLVSQMCIRDSFAYCTIKISAS